MTSSPAIETSTLDAPLDGEIMSPWIETPEDGVTFLGKRFSHLEEVVLSNHFGGGITKSGIPVSSRTALSIATAARCVRVIAEGVAQLPLELWDRDPDGRRRRAVTHPLHKILTRRPNEWHTRMQLIETMTMHAVLTGNGFAYISRVGGEIREIIPIPPGCCHMAVDHDGTRRYRVWWYDGTGKEYLRHQILHVAGPSLNAIDGLDFVHELRDVFGLTLSITGQASKFHRRDRRPPGILTVDSALTAEQRNVIKESWEAAYGPNGEGGIAVLDKKFSFSPISSTGKDSESLDTLKFQVAEVCRVFGVFPPMVMADAGGSYGALEQTFLHHLMFTIDPWLQRWEESIGRDLLTDDDHQAGVYARFTRNAINRMSSDARKSYYQTALGTASSAGWLTPNEVRALEELDPLDGFDQPFFPRTAVPQSGGGAANRSPAAAQPLPASDSSPRRPGSLASDPAAGKGQP